MFEPDDWSSSSGLSGSVASSESLLLELLSFGCSDDGFSSVPLSLSPVLFESDDWSSSSGLSGSVVVSESLLLELLSFGCSDDGFSSVPLSLSPVLFESDDWLYSSDLSGLVVVSESLLSESLLFGCSDDEVVIASLLVLLSVWSEFEGISFSPELFTGLVLFCTFPSISDALIRLWSKSVLFIVVFLLYSSSSVSAPCVGLEINVALSAIAKLDTINLCEI